MIEKIDPNRIYCPAEVAELTNYAYSTITLKLREKKLKAYKPKGSRIYCVYGRDIVKWVQGTVSL